MWRERKVTVELRERMKLNKGERQRRRIEREKERRWRMQGRKRSFGRRDRRKIAVRVQNVETKCKVEEEWARILPDVATIDLQYPSFRHSATG